tara:strand:- start:652 stop:1332 length:681 start_codon:yes stop_codon:yes gene_type:complete
MEGKKKGLLLLSGVIAGALVVLAGACFYYWEELSRAAMIVGDFLKEHTFLLFATIAVLPAFVVPVFPLLVVAGWWGEINDVWSAWIYTSCALIINLTWTYWLASGPGRNLIEKILRRTKYDIPKPDQGDELLMALILRLVPGVPFIFTNYALGLIRMPFWRYFMVSAPILIVTAGGYVLAVGGALGLTKETSSRNLGYFFFGISIILAMIVVGRIVYRKYGSEKQV